MFGGIDRDAPLIKGAFRRTAGKLGNHLYFKAEEQRRLVVLIYFSQSE